MESGDWRRQPLTWALLRTHLTAWFLRHRRPMAIGLVAAALAWVGALGLARLYDHPLPTDITPVRVTDYAQAYAVYREGPKLLLERARGGSEAMALALVALMVVWMAAYDMGGRGGPRPKKRPVPWMAILVFAVSAALWYPSLDTLTHPQTIVVDPVADQISMNGVVWGPVSAIDEFEGIQRWGYRSSWAWFGIKWKDGTYSAFDADIPGGGNVVAIAGYLNGYLILYRRGQRPAP